MTVCNLEFIASIALDIGLLLLLYRDLINNMQALTIPYLSADWEPPCYYVTLT
jgi:hypothetical protein